MAVDAVSETDFQLVYIPTENVAGIWDQVAAFMPMVVERSRGRHTLQSLLTDALSGATQLWCVWDGQSIKAVVGTSLGETPSGMKLATVDYLSGLQLARWVHLLDEIEEWARNNGCELIEMSARKGFAKHLPDYQVVSFNFEKAL